MMAIRTEHAGAKNGGGYWGTRAEAKSRCRRLRRIEDRKSIRLGKGVIGIVPFDEVKFLEQFEDVVLGEMARKSLKEKGGITLERLRKKLKI